MIYILFKKLKQWNGATAHNRTVYASPPCGGLGYEKTQSGLRPLCVFSPPHFMCAGIASQFLYRAQKTSHTARTLGEIEAKVLVNIESIIQAVDKIGNLLLE
jgi:hypothetical protein